MCKVLNKHAMGSHADAVYIGRGSKWGNPFRIGIDGDRAAVIAKYECWLRNQHHLLRALDELRGCNLLCFLRAQSLSWRSAAAARQRFARGAHRVVAHDRHRLAPSGRPGRNQAEDPEARWLATDFRPWGTVSRNWPRCRLRTQLERAPAPKARPAPASECAKQNQ
ncbi:MAG: DUF4326 domain-containing protein [Stellaceae bacterium]